MGRHTTEGELLEYEAEPCHCCKCFVCTNEPPWWMEDPWIRACGIIMVLSFAALGIFGTVIQFI